MFRLTLFARSDDFAEGFARIGSIDINASGWVVQQAVVPFPCLSTDFNERFATLVGPLEGILLPDTLYNFEVVLPHTAYLRQELDRLSRSLNAANLAAESSQSIAAALHAALDDATQLLQAAVRKQTEHSEALQTELANTMKDMTKRKGRDADKGRQLISDLEEQLQALQTVVDERTVAVQAANEKILAHRRATRRTSAQRRRFHQDRERIASAADRTSPLVVELSLDERRASLAAVDEHETRYCAAVRTPARGTVTLFVNHSALVLWDVSAD
jgi:exonuclease VII large subunit